MSARRRSRPWFRVQPEHYGRKCFEFADMRSIETVVGDARTERERARTAVLVALPPKPLRDPRRLP